MLANTQKLIVSLSTRSCDAQIRQAAERRPGVSAWARATRTVALLQETEEEEKKWLLNLQLPPHAHADPYVAQYLVRSPPRNFVLIPNMVYW